MQTEHFRKSENTMHLKRYTDVDAFYQAAGEFLLRHEAENCLIVGICTALRENIKAYGTIPPYFVTVADDVGIIAAAIMTPPHKLVLSYSDIPEALEMIAVDAIAANGSASFNAQSGGTCVNVADTNGQDGFHNISAKWFGVDAYGRLVLIEKDGDGSDLVVAFMPLNGGRVDIAHLGGAWYLETELRANPEEKSEMFVLWVDGDSGEFVFGTQHEPTGSSADPNECWTTFYSDNRYGAYEAYGNGVETGFLREREGWKGMGIVRPAIDPDKGGLDTNGDCGMHNVDTTPGNDLFLFRPSPTDPDVLLGWESGESESFSFRRVTSKANSLVGAWKHYDDFDYSIPELSVFFPGGQFFHIMYDANSDTIDQGVRRERWVFQNQAPQLGFTTEGFAYCVDTIDDTPADPNGYCGDSGTRWDEVKFNPELTEGTHDKGFMRKITQP